MIVQNEKKKEKRGKKKRKTRGEDIHIGEIETKKECPKRNEPILEKKKQREETSPWPWILVYESVRPHVQIGFVTDWNVVG